MYDSEVMCRKKVDAPWSIYRDFTAIYFRLGKRLGKRVEIKLEIKLEVDKFIFILFY